jgi:hypothetical protein
MWSASLPDHLTLEEEHPIRFEKEAVWAMANLDALNFLPCKETNDVSLVTQLIA